MKALRRFESHADSGRRVGLSKDHPAVIEGRSIFRTRANKNSNGVLVSGFNSRKIGKMVTKGKWSGFPIYTLTLEERKTCPRSCDLWMGCYGNKMHLAVRHQAGPELELRLEAELTVLQYRHPSGYVVRLHVLGDFYSREYVVKWIRWLIKFPALHVYGYTARVSTDPIGLLIKQAVSIAWPRFAIRSSNRAMKRMPSAIVIRKASEAGKAIVCPAQTGASACCGTCGLCWNSRKTIAFLEH